MRTDEDISLRPRQAAEFLGIGLTTLWRYIGERPDFPRPIKISSRVTVLPRSQLVAWRNAQAKVSA